MKKEEICCFAGHRNIGDIRITDKIEKIARVLIEKDGVKEFWIGKYGDFDRYAASVIRKLKKEYNDIALVLILAYIPSNKNKEIFEENYDSTCVLGGLDNTPYKYRIIKANQEMVRNSGHMISYVKYEWGGAYKTIQYAEKTGSIKIYNII